MFDDIREYGRKASACQFEEPTHWIVAVYPNTSCPLPDPWLQTVGLSPRKYKLPSNQVVAETFDQSDKVVIRVFQGVFAWWAAALLDQAPYHCSNFGGIIHWHYQGFQSIKSNPHQTHVCVLAFAVHNTSKMTPFLARRAVVDRQYMTARKDSYFTLSRPYLAEKWRKSFTVRSSFCLASFRLYKIQGRSTDMERSDVPLY